jgi:2,3-bisphosphoglycerate-dependent phosphoglycerate mutase
MTKLILLRHGQSQWNLENRFTGWVDVELTAAGEEEARQAGRAMANAGVKIDKVYASVLQRAIWTACLALKAADQLWTPMVKDWRLNERHYGGLTGLNKAETAEIHGEAQVRIWRRSYDQPPPPLAPGGPYDFSADRRYAGLALPDAESLATTLARVLPYWSATIVPDLHQDATVLIAAHGNSLRAIVKHLFEVADSAIVEVEIPTGNPLLVELSSALKPLSARYLDAARAAPLPL